MKLSLKYMLVVAIFSVSFFSVTASAGNFGVGTHAGYGVLEYEEDGRSESTQNVLFLVFQESTH
jgi:hypothetical protein